jgi:hypothetical protein
MWVLQLRVEWRWARLSSWLAVGQVRCAGYCDGLHGQWVGGDLWCAIAKMP